MGQRKTREHIRAKERVKILEIVKENPFATVERLSELCGRSEGSVSKVVNMMYPDYFLDRRKYHQAWGILPQLQYMPEERQEKDVEEGEARSFRLSLLFTKYFPRELYMVLKALATRKRTITELKTFARVSHSFLLGILPILKVEGFVTLNVDQADRRFSHVKLTDIGKNLLNALDICREALILEVARQKEDHEGS